MHLRRMRGFSLVEILVGLLIGLITTVVVAQILSQSEARKRTAVSGTDALIDATLALYAIERDAKNAGFGMTTVATGGVGCEICQQKGNDPVSSFVLTPVSITEGANGAADTIRLLASSKTGIVLPTRISVDHPDTAANFFVDSDLGIQENDLMIAVPSAGCTATTSCTASPKPSGTWATVFQVTNDPNPGGGNNNGQGQGQNQVLHNSGQSVWNKPGGQNIFPSDGYGSGDYLINLGQMLDHTYSIVNNGLRLVDFNRSTDITTTLDLYPQIVQLQAVYGKDDGVGGGTAGDGVVDTWNTTSPAANDGLAWRRIRAIRVALVARSQLLEKEIVTQDGETTATTCAQTTPHPASVCWKPDPAGNGVKIDLNINNANPDWQRYRYRVFETTIPLRNIIWQQ